MSLLPAPPAVGQGFKKWPWHARQQWLKTEHEKVVKDSERIVVLARNLRHEVEEKAETAGFDEISERARSVESKAGELREAVEEANENFLSVPVVRLAEELRGEARLLRKSFEDHAARRKLERFRNFCREIEQRAEAVRKRASVP